jgi:hypothetical protein
MAPAVVKQLRDKHPPESASAIEVALAGARAASAAFANGESLAAAQAAADNAAAAAAAEASARRTAGESAEEVLGSAGWGEEAPAGAAGSAAAAAEAALFPQLEEFVPLPDADDLFSPDRLKSAITNADASSGPGPDGLRYSHLQAAVKGGGRALPQLGRLARLVVDCPDLLPPLFWKLHASARLLALGDAAKARPVAIGGTFRRLLGRIFARQHAEHFAEIFAKVGQYGVGAKAGAEVVALAARLLHESGAWIIAVDGQNAFNSIHRAAVLPAAASLLGSGFGYIAQIYGAEPADLLVELPDGGGVEVIPSASGV